jgi:filamentous hemagglutinin family protein
MSLSTRVGWLLGIGMSSISTFSSSTAVAQITPDGTLGTESSVVTPNVDINGTPSDRIDRGATRGSNLFHSFEQFNVEENRGAYFSNPSGIENIITRVTGSSASNINGTLGVLGSANLFFINPNGIIFGSNARLEVGGSFVGSTASGIQFGEQGFFSASNPNAPSLLTVNPSALFFNPSTVAEIANSSAATAGLNPTGGVSTGLRVPNGESLLLVGGNINIDGGSLRAYEGRVELAAIQAPGVVGLNIAENTFTLSIPQDTQRANVSLSGGAEIKVRASDGGSIAINAQNLSLTERSVLLAGIDLGLGNQQSIAGDIVINATGETQLSGNSFIANTVAPRGEGIAGNINITTGALTLGSGAQLATGTLGRGDAGNVIIDVRGDVSIDNRSAAFSNVVRGGVGKGGNVEIKADSLFLTNGSQLQATTFGRGDAGNVIIDVRGDVSFDNESTALSNVEFGGVGNGGNVEIRADSLSLTNLSLLSAGSRGQGDAGNIIIDVRGDVSFDNSGVFSSVIFFGGIGNGGNVEIRAGSLSLTNGSLLSANTRGQGDAGNVIINVRGDVSFDNSDASSEVNFFSVNLPGVNFFDGVVKGGNIEITADSLSLTNGSRLFANTLGQGDAGNIEINTRDRVSISGTSSITGSSSGLFTSNFPNNFTTTGKGGDIIVNTPYLLVSDGAVLDARTTNDRAGGNITLNVSLAEILNGGQVLSTSSGAGSAGTITVNATDRVIINGSDSTFNDRVAQFGTEEVAPIDASSGLFVRAESRGSAGNIEITAPSILLDNTGTISADTTGGGGNIQLLTPLLTLRRGSSITTNATGSEIPGGNINIDARDGFIIAFDGENSDISANSEEFRGGNVQINAQGVFGIEARQLESDETNDITATGANSELAGTIVFNVPDIEPTQGQVQPPELVNTDNLIANSCIARTNRQVEGTFFITGSGGLPYRPGERGISQYTTGRPRRVSNTSLESNSTSRPWRKGDPIVEPSGVFRLPSGRVVLSRECSDS